MVPNELQNDAQRAEKGWPMVFQYFCYQVIRSKLLTIS